MNELNRKKDFENIAICWFVILVITSATIYFAITGELMVQTGIVCFVALYTDRRKVRVKCLSEAIADSIVEDFLLHGIYDKNSYE